MIVNTIKNFKYIIYVTVFKRDGFGISHNINLIPYLQPHKNVHL